MSDRILVTGAAGFVGQHLVDRLAEQGHQITALDIERQPPELITKHVDDNVTYISGSILHEDFIRTEVFTSPNAYDRIFHLAAIVGVDRYTDVRDPLYIMDVNINGTKLLLELARGSNARFIYTSTSEVYGKNEELPWSEEDDRIIGPPTQNRWSYSSVKGVCEHMIHMLGEVDPGLSTTVVRPFNLYGPHQRPKFVVPKFLEDVANGEVPTVYRDGTQKRCFTYIGDFVEGLIAASEREQGVNETYNLGSTDEIDILTLAEKVMEIGGLSDQDPEFVDPTEIHGDNYEEPDRRIPDISRAKQRLDWEPDTSLSEGLQKTYDAIQDANDD